MKPLTIPSKVVGTVPRGWRLLRETEVHQTGTVHIVPIVRIITIDHATKERA